MPLSQQSFVEREVSANEFALLPVIVEHTEIVPSLPFPDSGHRDPFDRLLVAQPLVENIPVITNDVAFDHYPSAASGSAFFVA